MATLFRATVMLSVLVGLPAAWVYYGPLPPKAQRTLDQVIGRGKEAMGWSTAGSEAKPAYFDPTSQQLASIDSLEEAPAFQAAPVGASPVAASAPRATTPLVGLAPEPNLPQTAANVESPPENPVATETELDRQVEALLAELRELGVAEYALESWGTAGELYRFRCEMPLGVSESFTQQFEAVTADPHSSIAQVVAEVSSWRSTQQQAN